MLVSDNGVGKTNWWVGAGFTTSSTTSLTLTTTAIGGSTLDALKAQIPKRPKTFTNFATRYRPFKVGMKKGFPSARQVSGSFLPR